MRPIQRLIEGKVALAYIGTLVIIIILLLTTAKTPEVYSAGCQCNPATGQNDCDTSSMGSCHGGPNGGICCPYCKGAPSCCWGGDWSGDCGSTPSCTPACTACSTTDTCGNANACPGPQKNDGICCAIEGPGGAWWEACNGDCKSTPCDQQITKTKAGSGCFCGPASGCIGTTPATTYVSGPN